MTPRVQVFVSPLRSRWWWGCGHCEDAKAYATWAEAFAAADHHARSCPEAPTRWVTQATDRLGFTT